jgi:hypothetical protein
MSRHHVMDQRQRPSAGESRSSGGYRPRGAPTWSPPQQGPIRRQGANQIWTLARISGRDLSGRHRVRLAQDPRSRRMRGSRHSARRRWAHVLRKFEAAAADQPEAEHALEWIGKLYKVDRSADCDLDLLTDLGRGASAAVLDDLQAWLPSQFVLRALSIGNAAAYTEANWSRLTQFVDDVRIPLDNNATERGSRGPVVGRKNHCGSKSRDGPPVAATLYSLVETAKLHDVDPTRYQLEAVRASSRGEILLPWPLPH